MKHDDLIIKNLLGLEHTEAAGIFDGLTWPWEALSKIKSFILAYIEGLPKDEYFSPKENVWIHKSAIVYESAYIDGPCVIGAGTEVRHSAFIRGSAFVGRGCVVGNSTELKNVILFDKVQVPHYNYVGDSILGYCAHMGAGSITSNVRSDKTLVRVHFDDGDMETGLKKFGAVIGDRVEIGCGSVLNPGSIVGNDSIVYPLSSLRGVINPQSIYKKQGEAVKRM